MNHAFLIGNLTRDTEVRYTSHGTAVADIGVAINHSGIRHNAADGQKHEDVTFRSGSRVFALRPSGNCRGAIVWTRGPIRAATFDIGAWYGFGMALKTGKN